MSELNKKQRQALEEFADGSISLEALAEALNGVMEMKFSDQERRLEWHIAISKPEVQIKLSHINRAMDKHAHGQITTEQLADWAAMLLLNDAFGWEGHDENEIAELLNDISFLTIKPQPSPEDERA